MLDDLFNLLADEDFQDPNSGLLSFPAYIYTYDPEREYEMRDALQSLKNKLQRPTHYQVCLLVNIYDEFIAYLKDQTLGGRSLFDRMIEMDKEDPDRLEAQLRRHAKSDRFLQGLADKMQAHAAADGNRTYVLLHGMGSIHPFITTSQLLDKFESRIQDYKLVIMYPGTYEDHHYRMFGELERQSVYRGSCLNQILA